MAYNQEKIDAYKLKLDIINKKIKTLNAQKNKLEKQIRDMEDREIINVVRQNECTVPTLANDLALAHILRQNNLTQADVIELINDLGGQGNEKIENNQV